MAYGHALMNKQDGPSIGKALYELSQNVKEYAPSYWGEPERAPH